MLSELFKTEQNSLAKLNGMLDELRRRKKMCYPNPVKINRMFMTERWKRYVCNN